MKPFALQRLGRFTQIRHDRIARGVAVAALAMFLSGAVTGAGAAYMAFRANPVPICGAPLDTIACIILEDTAAAH